MAKKELSASEIVETHRPKNFKYKYYFKSDEFLKKLCDEKFDILSTDTLQNDDLTNHAYNNSTWNYYERNIVGKAKEPTVIEDGIIFSKKMVTKADKKLQRIGFGFFDYNSINYVAIKLEYMYFDILELFVKL